jgi:branched-chain amino acid aminotransferase
MNQESPTTFSCAVRNLDLISLKDAVLPIGSKEVFFNFSVYESIKIIKGVPVFLEDHLQRLFESAARLEIVHTITDDDIISMARRLIDADRIEKATLRVQLIGGSEPTLFLFPEQLPRYSGELYRRGASAVTYLGERILPEVKSNSLLLNYLAQREAVKRHALEALLIDRENRIMEGSRTNVYAVSGSTLITAGAGVLAGVTRKHILEAAQDEGIDICFEAPLLGRLFNGDYDELFISSTSMGAMPLIQVDDCILSGDFSIAGRLHSRIQAAEAAYVNERLS